MCVCLSECPANACQIILLKCNYPLNSKKALQILLFLSAESKNDLHILLFLAADHLGPESKKAFQILLFLSADHLFPADSLVIVRKKALQIIFPNLESHSDF